MRIDQLRELITPLIKHLPVEEKEILREALLIARNSVDYKYIRDWLKNPKKWRMPRVSMDTFLDHEYYLNIGGNVYPKVREICREIVEGGYREGVEVAGIGAGKSFSAEILACYAAHYLLCLRNPHDFYNLAKDKSITIINMGTSATQAWEVVFSGIRTLIAKAPFFMQYKPQVLQSSIRFDQEKILMTCGNSKSTTPLGYNVFYAILDEAAFYMDNDDKSVAADIYESLQRRIVSRFGNDGLLMMISSPRYIEDFIMRKLDESLEIDKLSGKKANPHIYSIQLPTWKVKSKASMELTTKFYFNQRTKSIIDRTEMSYSEMINSFKVNLIDDPKFDGSYDIWEIPGEYRASFRQNPDKAKRDFGATPSETLSGFFPNYVVLKEGYNHERKNPVKPTGGYRFEDRPLRVPYYIHIDLGMNRDGRGDYTGFCMGHCGGWREDEDTKEQRLHFHIDLVERIGFTTRLGEVDLGEVRQRIYDLVAMGYNIKLVTLDGYQSTDLMQILKKKGIRADYLSVDRTIDPYNILKEAFYEKRIDIPFVEELDRELRRLELVKGVKVDHPPGGSKDLSDCVAGVCANIVEHTPVSAMRMAMSQPTPQNKALQQHAAVKAKEKHYRSLKRIVERQLEVENSILF